MSSTTAKDRQLIDAMMLLEFAWQSEEVPLNKCGLGDYDVLDLAAAAHSLIQANYMDAPVSEQAKEILAKIATDTAIEDAMLRAKRQ